MKVQIEKYDDNGFGIAKLGKKEISVPFTSVGDVVEIRKWGREKKKIVAKDFEIIEYSSHRVQPRCAYFGKCGGCLWQHIPYKEQIKIKEEKLSKLLDLEVDVLPSPKIYGHRNRIDVAITTQGIGFRERGKWWKTVDIAKCEVFGDKSELSLKGLREFMEDFNLKPWDLRKGEGFLRYIVLREGKFTGELMVNLVTYEGTLPEEVENYFNFADSLYWSINATKSDVSYGDPKKFWGSEFITEMLDDVVYLIHPNSFFQTNSYQAVNLVKMVSKFVEGERILDLYAGVGTFGIYLAKREFKVEGIEINPFAVEIANKNVEMNKVRAIFRVGEDKDVESLKDYDTVIVDPPRGGLHPKLIKKILRDKPSNIVYVSCNPKTLKDNLNILKQQYKIDTAVGLDMFPHTPHIESVVKLTLKV